MIKSLQKNRVINCVKGCGKIQEGEEGDLARICCKEKVVKNVQKSGLSAMMLSVSRLEWMEKVVRCKVEVELKENNFF